MKPESPPPGHGRERNPEGRGKYGGSGSIASRRRGEMPETKGAGVVVGNRGAMLLGVSVSGTGGRNLFGDLHLVSAPRQGAGQGDSARGGGPGMQVLRAPARTRTVRRRVPPGMTRFGEEGAKGENSIPLPGPFRERGQLSGRSTGPPPGSRFARGGGAGKSSPWRRMYSYMTMEAATLTLRLCTRPNCGIMTEPTSG
jgi:hypothetical protein